MGDGAGMRLTLTGNVAALLVMDDEGALAGPDTAASWSSDRRGSEISRMTSISSEREDRLRWSKN